MHPHCLMTRHSQYLIQELLFSLIFFPTWQWFMKPQRTSTGQQNLQASLTTMFSMQDSDFLYCWNKIMVLKFLFASQAHFYCHIPIYHTNSSNHLILKFQHFLSVFFKLLAGKWNHFLQLFFQHQLTAANSLQFCLQSLNPFLKAKGSHIWLMYQPSTGVILFC